MIELCTLSMYPDLYEKMVATAKSTARKEISFRSLKGDESIKIARSYNQMGSESKADILLFVHDDIEFLSNGWDVKLEEALKEYDTAGVIGAWEYNGGRVFDAGIPKCLGKIVSNVEGERWVKVLDEVNGPSPAMVVDGCFLAVTKEHFNKHKFDEQFDELFFWDLDYCLESRCCVVDILVAHIKPPKYYGKYPPNLKPITNYWDKFHAKHGLTPQPQKNQVCNAIKLAKYEDLRSQKA